MKNNSNKINVIGKNQRNLGLNFSDQISDALSSVTLSNAGTGLSIVDDGAGPALTTKSISYGSGIVIVNSGQDLSISATGSNISLGSAGGSNSLVSDGTGPALAVKGISAGTAVTITDSGTNLIINSTGSNVSLATAGGTYSLVSDGMGPILTTKGLNAGTGITMSTSSSQVTINSTGSNISLGNAGGESLVYAGTGPTLTTKGVGGSQYIQVRDDSTQLTILNTLYSAGFWVPTMTSETGDIVYTISAYNCQYVKIGNLVTCHMFVAWSAKTGTTNGVLRFNLPFTPTNSASYRSGGPVSYVDNISFGLYLATQITFTVPYVHLIDVQNPSFRVNTANVLNTGEIQCQFSYIVD